MNPIKPLEQSSDDLVLSSEESSFGEILEQFEAESQPEERFDSPLQGTVLAIADDAVLLDIGRKIEGQLPLNRVSGPDGKVLVEVGQKLNVNVLGLNDRGYYNLTTTEKIEAPRDWSEFQAAFSAQTTVVCTVTELIKGGFRCELAGVKAFLPASRSGVREQAEMAHLVGQQIEAKIIKLDTAKEDVVVDRRVVLEEAERLQKEAAFAALQEGQAVKGRVRNLTDYGAFLDVGGVDGLLHVADISWNRIGKPADVLKVGDEVDVKILKINPNTKKISLGMKQLVPDPWSVAEERYPVQSRVSGKVVRLTDFGAFVELEPGVDGMVHVSELSWSKKVRKPSDALQVGDQVEVVVLGVNAAEKRIALGLKQALGDPWADVEKKFAVGSVVEAPVINLAQFGAFVDLGDGFEGLIHIGDITREKRLNHPKEMLNAGQTVRAQVIEIDRERRRIRLGMKQLEPTSLDIFIQEHQVGEQITGRVVEVHGNRLRIELSEGVIASVKVAAPAESEQPAGGVSESRVDVSSAAALLAAKFKSGGFGGGGSDEKSKKDQVRPGQLKAVKITNLDAANRKVEIELV
jgi:small subunit ribosomal protein S1